METEQDLESLYFGMLELEKAVLLISEQKTDVRFCLGEEFASKIGRQLKKTDSAFRRISP